MTNIDLSGLERELHAIPLKSKGPGGVVGVVKAGQVVKVKVLEVDLARQRIALSMRMSDEPGKSGPRDRDTARGAPLSRQQARHNSPPPAGNAMAAAFAKLRK